MEKEKLVLHVARTSLAGAPIRLVNALNKHTKYAARLLDFIPLKMDDGSYKFPEDLDWHVEQDRAIAKNMIKMADIIHFHHYMDPVLNPFLVDFTKETKPDCKIIRQFHSPKDFVRKVEFKFDESYAKDTLPKFVIPHCAERTFLDLDIVPNIVPIDEEYCMPYETNNKKLKVLYSASCTTPRLEERWATKGYPEVSAKLKELSKKLDFEYVEISHTEFYETMQLKREADIIIGDTVTGSYHLTELEALSMGKPCLTYLDARSAITFINTFKSKDIPFVNVYMDEIENALTELINNKKLREDIGKFSREWMEKYYREEILIQKFVDVYDKILAGETIIREDADKYPEVKEFLYNKIYDYRWENAVQNQ